MFISGQISCDVSLMASSVPFFRFPSMGTQIALRLDCLYLSSSAVGFSLIDLAFCLFHLHSLFVQFGFQLSIFCFWLVLNVFISSTMMCFGL